MDLPALDPGSQADMQPEPDQRWSHILGGITADGSPIQMSFESLAGLSDEWVGLVGDAAPIGIRELLATSRSLFAHSWFDYEFMAIACLVALQAIEATFRQVVFPTASRKTSFRALVDNAERRGSLGVDDAERIRAGVKLRNSLAHPGAQVAYTVGMAAPIIERSHRVVDALCRAAP